MSPLVIRWVGEGFAVVEKPPGLLSIPGKLTSDSVAARLPWLIPGCHGPSVAHRLDQDTSGLMVVGLTPCDHRALSVAFAAGEVEKVYFARVAHAPTAAQGTIELPLAPDLNHRPRQVVDDARGKASVTHWWRLAGRLLRVQPLQGRTHQIRVHLAKGLGLPIVGDRLYGGATAPRLMLHATSLVFPHPRTGERIGFSSPAPF